MQRRSRVVMTTRAQAKQATETLPRFRLTQQRVEPSVAALRDFGGMAQRGDRNIRHDPAHAPIILRRSNRADGLSKPRQRRSTGLRLLLELAQPRLHGGRFFLLAGVFQKLQLVFERSDQRFGFVFALKQLLGPMQSR